MSKNKKLKEVEDLLYDMGWTLEEISNHMKI